MSGTLRADPHGASEHVPERKALRCDMKSDCTQPVTHIGEKGFIYCTKHAACRRGWERCRTMRKWELTLLRSGKPLPSYRRTRKPVPTATVVGEC
jgi:hypothetical protein